MMVKENVWRGGAERGAAGTWACVGLAAVAAVAGAVVVLHASLPAPRPASAPRSLFSGERAHRHVAALAALGPRPAGSVAADLHAPRLLLDAVRAAAARAAPHHRIEIDAWTADGNLSLSFLDGMTSVYRGVRGVAVRVSAAGSSPGPALLLNCHYDTVEGSPGAGDDAAGCAVLLELLDVVVAAPAPHRHSLLLLFNGAEEDIMLAAHAFVTQHKWSRAVRGVVNLDACGAGGRELLFQTGPTDHWLLYVYASVVPYPFASCVAQEVFESGLIPADTDYRVFTHFGNVSGLSLAYTANGYVYHTPLDTADRVSPAALQHTGDNLAALVAAALRDPRLAHDPPRAPLTTPPLLLDFGGLGNVTVGPGLVAAAILLAVAHLAVSARTARRQEGARVKRWAGRVVRVWGQLALAGAAGLCAAVGGGALVHAVGVRMFWYGRGVLVAVYGGIAVFVAGYVAAGVKDVRAAGDAVVVGWGAAAAVGAAVGLRSSVLAVLWAGGVGLGGLLAGLVGSGVGWVLGALPPLALWMSISVALEQVLLPVLGRAGVGIPADVTVAVLTATLALGAVSWLATLAGSVSEAVRRRCAAAGAGCVVVLALLGAGAGGRPYSAHAPQRIMSFHSQSVDHRAASGDVTSPVYWIPELDVNTRDTVMAHLKGARVAECAEGAVWCGWPYPLPVYSLVRTGLTAPAPPLSPFPTPSARRQRDAVSLSGSGAARVVVLAAPVSPGDWLERADGGTLLEAAARWRGRRAYFISLVNFVAPHTWKLELRVRGGGGPVHVTVAAHVGGGDGLERDFPPWTTHTKFTVHQHHYEL